MREDAMAGEVAREGQRSPADPVTGAAGRLEMRIVGGVGRGRGVYMDGFFMGPIFSISITFGDAC